MRAKVHVFLKPGVLDVQGKAVENALHGLGWPQVDGCAPLPAVEAGLHLCVPVDSLAREQQLLTAARQAGVEMSGLSRYWLPGSDPAAITAGLVLGFAAVPHAQIACALQALRQAWGCR